MALISRIGVFCNCGSGKSLTGSTVLATAVSSRDWKNFKSPNSSTMDTTHTMTRPMANLPTAQTLTSVVSCPIRGLWGCLVSSMFQSLLQVRCVWRHQWALLQRREEVRQPEAHQADRNGEIQGAEAEALPAEARRDQPVEIDKAHQQNEQRDRGQQFEIALQIAREQQREGQREMADHRSEEHTSELQSPCNLVCR